MRETTSILIFQAAWGLLILIAVAATLAFEDAPKKQAGFLTNLPVVVPFVLAFGFFYVRWFWGHYQAIPALQIAGVAVMVLGLLGYMASMLSLRRNWSFFASIKEGHRLVITGPYKYVRHPMYFFMILAILGSGFLISNFLIILYTPFIGVIYYLRAKKEEELLKEELPEYKNYVRETKMLIPGIF